MVEYSKFLKRAQPDRSFGGVTSKRARTTSDDSGSDHMEVVRNANDKTDNDDTIWEILSEFLESDDTSNPTFDAELLQIEDTIPKLLKHAVTINPNIHIWVAEKTFEDIVKAEELRLQDNILRIIQVLESRPVILQLNFPVNEFGFMAASREGCRSKTVEDSNGFILPNKKACQSVKNFLKFQRQLWNSLL